MGTGNGSRVLATVLVLAAGGLVAVGVSGALEAGASEAEPTAREGAAVTASADVPADAADAPLVTVYKSPTCGCCGGWVDHLREEGFTVEVQDMADPRELSALKAELGVTSDLASCHTARIGDHVIEGHVPADAIRRFLALEDPDARGLAVPGMPIGSPGMEVPGRAPEPYAVLAFGDDGTTRVFEER